MLRCVLFTLTFFFTLVNPAKADKTYSFISAKFQIEHEVEPVYTLDALVGRRYSENWGVSAYFIVTQGWAQAYAGPTYAPAEWVELSLNIGAQHSEAGLDLRYAATAWFGYEWFEFLGIVEFDNPSFQGDDLGVWYDLTGIAKVDWFAGGLKIQRNLGLGPYLRFTHEETGLNAWFTWTPIDVETGNGNLSRFLVGATLSL